MYHTVHLVEFLCELIDSITLLLRNPLDLLVLLVYSGTIYQSLIVCKALFWIHARI